ncbi:serine hydrolase [Neolewinella lacunae]|uniref:Serine hydrolase n=1 Tax=Neolewinella lacunae TaxID=1517758 RepID=A0A923PIA2_9BACT|nr:serine hydrolase [Neolewinella lacunae]MBC6994658.1 serine hydrolase [Neolewinella lacunae]MDN3634530.1 serine hydrolase [Neolewinella lacunae]
MKRLLLPLITFGLLCTAQPLHAGSWTDGLFDWLSSWFSSEPAPTEPPPVALTPAQLDSLQSSPLGRMLSLVPQSDTLAVGATWPFESLTPAIDLERHNRLLRETVVLTRPAGRLPYLQIPALRVIYRQDQRPEHFLAIARRFTSVQELPYEESLPQLLPTASPLPTVVLADDPVGSSPFNADWYQQLFGLPIGAVTFLHFGDPALLGDFPQDWTLLNTPMRCKETEVILAQAIFGAELIDGRLARSTAHFSAGTGYRLGAVRGGFRLPELLGIDRERFADIDYHINRGIRYRAMPGAQLVVLKDGHVVYEKAYGNHVYRQQAVDPGDLYDLASVTKAAATSLAVMKLYDKGAIDLNARVRDYLPEFKKKAIGGYRVEQLLAHHTGLQSDIPLNGLLSKKIVADLEDAAFSLPIAQNRWMATEVPGLVAANVLGRIDYTSRPVYRYSDLNFYLLQLIVEAAAGEPMEELLQREFYLPLQLGKLGFRPTEKFPLERLVPTVVDPWMRGGLVRGYVHDEGAALLGGVAGHAGLFGNAHDLARLFQMLLDGGTYAGRELLSPETVALFTDRNRYNYRALGFDRLAGGWRGVINEGAAETTFGHTGFSGTSVWADPENDLVYVLLTNRIHPDPKNERFQTMDIRGKVHRAIYRALNTWEVVM